MASTARSNEDKEEFFDPPEVLEKKATEVAEMVRASRHFIVFTGAGISTSAGIPDFRSGMDTKIETGPGVWELQAQGKSRGAEFRTTSTSKAVPTPTHMMFVRLMEEGTLKAVVSQNCDGLHRRSGLPSNGLFELHGNSNVERCTKCKVCYLRDYMVRTARGVKMHQTGRKCDNPSCRGDLVDTIVNFGENLPQKTLERSFEHAQAADVCLAMGSSLTVTPASDIPKTVGSKQRLVVVNLQATPLDGLADVRIFAKCDDFSRLLMAKMGLDIPQFRLRRRLILRAKSSSSQMNVLLEQVDMEGNPFSYLKGVIFEGVASKRCDPEKQRLECNVPIGRHGQLNIRLEFQGHYEEPLLSLPLSLTGRDIEVDVALSYNPFTREWTVERSDSSHHSKAPKP